MRFLFVFLLVVCAFQQSTAQDLFKRLSPKFSTGVHRQGFYTDLSLALLLHEKDVGFLNFNTLFLYAGLENNYKFRHDFRLVPKVGIEANINVLSFRVQNRFYPDKNLDFRKASWQVCPETGLNLFNTVSIMYGYNFALTNAEVTPSLKHQVSLTINLSTILTGE